MNIDARIIDGKLFVDIDTLVSFYRSEEGPYIWTQRAADAMQVPDDIMLANGMRAIVENLEANALVLWEDLSE